MSKNPPRDHARSIPATMAAHRAELALEVLEHRLRLQTDRARLQTAERLCDQLEETEARHTTRETAP